MSFIIVCQCGQQMTVQDDQPGLEALCVNCHSRIRIPPKPGPGSPAVPATMLSGPGQSPPLGPAPYPPSGGAPGGGTNLWLKPHRGTTIIILGILGLVFGGCCCGGLWAGIPAIVMASADLKEMNAGAMDPSARGLTNAGLILGLISLALMFLGPLVSLFGGGIPWQHYGDFRQWL